jgi:hypothetical protein
MELVRPQLDLGLFTNKLEEALSAAEGLTSDIITETFAKPPFNGSNPFAASKNSPDCHPFSHCWLEDFVIWLRR